MLLVHRRFAGSLASRLVHHLCTSTGGSRCTASSPANLLRRCLSGDQRLYTKKHEWIQVREAPALARVGISSHAQEALGDVVYVQAPELGSRCAQFDEVGAIESVKAASEVLAPVSGEIVAVNSKLDDKPGLVNTDCYGEGWLYEMRMEKEEELRELLDEEGYAEFLKSAEQ